MHLVGFTIGIYYDARTYERQIYYSNYAVFTRSGVQPETVCIALKRAIEIESRANK
jgi:hypothetical protein